MNDKINIIIDLFLITLYFILQFIAIFIKCDISNMGYFIFGFIDCCLVKILIDDIIELIGVNKNE